MSTTHATTPTRPVVATLFEVADTARPEQLCLLDTSDLPLQFRLDMNTRRRGLAHVAELRRLLAERGTAGDHRAA